MIKVRNLANILEDTIRIQMIRKKNEWLLQIAVEEIGTPCTCKCTCSAAKNILFLLFCSKDLLREPPAGHVYWLECMKEQIEFKRFCDNIIAEGVKVQWSLDLLDWVQRRPPRWAEWQSSSHMEPGWDKWDCPAGRKEGSWETLKLLPVPKGTPRELDRDWDKGLEGEDEGEWLQAWDCPRSRGWPLCKDQGVDLG